MKILVVNSHPDRSEAHIYAALRTQGMDVHVVCDPAAKRGSILQSSNVPVMFLHFRSRFDFSAIRLLRETIRSGSFDLVHAVNKRGCTHVMAALAGMQIPVVAYRGIIGNLCPWNPEIGLTYFSSKVRHIICVCEAVRQYLLSVGISGEKAVTIHKGHDPAWYQPADRRRLSEFGITEDAFVICCAAKIRPRKGIDVLIRAVKLIQEQNIHLLLVGEIADESIAKLIKQVRLEDKIHLAGYRADAPSLTGACDCFAMPSLRREGLPRAVLEAMFQGVPPIVTDVGGMPEIVEHDVSGIVVPPDDSDALAGSIRRLASDKMLRTRLGAWAKERAVSHFNVGQTVNAYKKVFFEAVAS